MEFARKVWKLLVGIKDGLVLLFMLLFFFALYAVLSVRPGVGKVHEGALLLDLDGVIVEEPSVPDPVTMLLSGEGPTSEYRARDIVRALRLAAKDDKVKAVVLDLSNFVGGGLVHLQDIGEALDEVRAAKKPVLAYGLAFIDDGLLLAAHADEIWVNPMGGAFITGPGGNNFYFAGLLRKLKVDARVYRVGHFKSAVEPWILEGPSEDSRKAFEAVYGAQWAAWKADFAKARPKVDLERISSDPVGWLKESGGDIAEANKAAGIVDRIGGKTEFGQRVAEIVGEDKADKTPGSFAHTPLRTYLAAHKPKAPGKAIGVVTVAGEIVDGQAGPGVAGGDRIADLLDDALDDDLAALVVRIDSPGGSVIAAEQIRAAIDRHKAKGIPIVVSMADYAASGGYWISTPASRIFAEPGTITGSIGVFAVVPTFDRALNDLGVKGGGVKTTPLSGQPDVLTGLAPEVSDMIQANVENIYGEFLALVEDSRGMKPENALDWADGRPWDGGTARQLGLVDEFGGLDEALAYAAKQAGLAEGKWHPEFLGGDADGLSALLRRLEGGQVWHAGSRANGLDLAGIAAERQAAAIRQALIQAERITSVRGMQAYCLECRSLTGPSARPGSPDGILSTISRLFGLDSLITAI